MYKRRDKEYVLDMLSACEKIIKYTKDLDFEAFLKDDKTIDACIRNVEVLGEAAKNISPEFKERYPEIEWRDIARTRDKLIHSYFSVDVEILWKIAKYNIPELKQKLEYVIQKEGWQDEI